MVFRTIDGLNALITGTPVQVALAICFWNFEDTKPQKEGTYESVIAGMRTNLGLESTANYQDICDANRVRLAEQLGLPAQASYDDIRAVDHRRLALILGLDPSATWRDLLAEAKRVCAVQLGLPSDAKWREVHNAYWEHPIRE